jgi:hypothetical protein
MIQFLTPQPTTATLETGDGWYTNVDEMNLLLINDTTDGVSSEDEEMSDASELFDVLDELELSTTPLTIPSDDETPILTDDLLDFDDDLDLFEPIKLEDLSDPYDTSTLRTDTRDATELLREQTPPTQPPPNPLPQNPDFNCLENLPYEIVERPRYSA